MFKILSISMFPLYAVSWIISNLLKLKEYRDMPTPFEFLQMGFEDPQKEYSL